MTNVPRMIRLLIIVAALVFGPGMIQLVHLSWQQRALARKQRQLEALHRQLATEQERLTADPVYVEGLIRSTFKVAKPRELVVPLDSDETDPKRRR